MIVTAHAVSCRCRSSFRTGRSTTGPSGAVRIATGSSAETGLLKTWPAAGPPLAWTTAGRRRRLFVVLSRHGRLYTLGRARRH